MSQRRRAKRTGLTLSHGKRWSVSPSWSLTPSPRRSNRRRRRARSNPTASTVSRHNKWSEFNLIEVLKELTVGIFSPLLFYPFISPQQLLSAFSTKNYRFENIFLDMLKDVVEYLWLDVFVLLLVSCCISEFVLTTVMFPVRCHCCTNTCFTISFFTVQIPPLASMKSNLHFLPSILFHYSKDKVPCSQWVSLSLFCWSKPVFYEFKRVLSYTWCTADCNSLKANTSDDLILFNGWITSTPKMHFHSKRCDTELHVWSLTQHLNYLCYAQHLKNGPVSLLKCFVWVMDPALECMVDCLVLCPVYL